MEQWTIDPSDPAEDDTHDWTQRDNSYRLGSLPYTPQRSLEVHGTGAHLSTNEIDNAHTGPQPPNLHFTSIQRSYESHQYPRPAQTQMSGHPRPLHESQIDNSFQDVPIYASPYHQSREASMSRVTGQTAHPGPVERDRRMPTRRSSSNTHSPNRHVGSNEFRQETRLLGSIYGRAHPLILSTDGMLPRPQEGEGDDANGLYGLNSLEIFPPGGRLNAEDFWGRSQSIYPDIPPNTNSPDAAFSFQQGRTGMRDVWDQPGTNLQAPPWNSMWQSREAPAQDAHVTGASGVTEFPWSSPNGPGYVSHVRIDESENCLLENPAEEDSLSYQTATQQTQLISPKASYMSPLNEFESVARLPYIGESFLSPGWKAQDDMHSMTTAVMDSRRSEFDHAVNQQGTGRNLLEYTNPNSGRDDLQSPFRGSISSRDSGMPPAREGKRKHVTDPESPGIGSPKKRPKSAKRPKRKFTEEEKARIKGKRDNGTVCSDCRKAKRRVRAFIWSRLLKGLICGSAITQRPRPIRPLRALGLSLEILPFSRTNPPKALTLPQVTRHTMVTKTPAMMDTKMPILRLPLH